MREFRRTPETILARAMFRAFTFPLRYVAAAQEA